MRRYRHFFTKTPFGRAVRFSLILHAGLLFFFLVIWPWLTPANRPPPQIVMVELTRGTSSEIGSGLKKALDLPQSTIHQPPLSPPPPPKPGGMKESKPPPKPKKESPSLFTKEMKDALAKVDRTMKPQQPTPPPEAAQTRDQTEGFKYGTTDEPRVPPNDPEYLRYQAEVRAKIMQEWIIPPHLAGIITEPKPRTGIIVLINNDGLIVSNRVEYPSGIAALDDSAVRAIQRTTSLPIPPERLKSEVFTDGFLIEFIPN